MTRVEGTHENDWLVTSDFEKQIYVLEGNDTVFAGNGNDSIYGGAGNDLLVGNQGNDYLLGMADDDVLQGSIGDDTLEGGAGDDVLYGEDGNDHLSGQIGEDSLVGGQGDDIYYVDADELTWIDDVNHTGYLQFSQNQSGTQAALITHFFRNSLGQPFLYQPEDITRFADGVRIHHDVSTQQLSIKGIDSDTQLIINHVDSLNPLAALTYTIDWDGLWFSDASGTIIRDQIYQLDALVADAKVLTTGTHAHDVIYALSQTKTNTVHAGDGNDTVYGAAGDDYIMGEAGSDLLSGLLGNDYVIGEEGDDELLGGLGLDTLLGGMGSDSLIGGDDEDLLDGGQGADLMQGGMGNDQYHVDDINDQIIESGWQWHTDFGYWVTGGVDTVISRLNYQLGENLENLVLLSDAQIGTGNSLNNQITGNDTANQLRGLEGSDTLLGGANSDMLWGGDAGDYLSGDDGDDLIYGESGRDELLGAADNDTLIGGDDHDTLVGGMGDDLMIGGQGSDRYEVDSLNDQVIEYSQEGFDVVLSTIDYRAPSEVEGVRLVDNYLLTGQTQDLIAYGNALNNSLLGNAGHNFLSAEWGSDYLDGAGGNDSLDGGEGNDTLQGGIDDVYVVVTPEPNGQIVTIVEMSTNDDVLDGGMGDDQLDGGSGSDRLWGGEGNDTLMGGGAQRDYIVVNEAYYEIINQPVLANDDYLDGGLGDDYLEGMSGNDTLYGGEGNDYLHSGDIEYERDEPDWTTISNYLDGQAGNDTLYGGNGQDTLYAWDDGGYDELEGGYGDDVYYIDGYYSADINHLEQIFMDDGSHCGLLSGDIDYSHYLKTNYAVTDSVWENVDGGYDIVYSRMSVRLWGDIEEVHLIGDVNADIVGNDFNNRLIANHRHNILDGGLGADTLIGGLGNDIYIIDDASDVINELTNQGQDIVISMLNGYQLAYEVETLYLGTGVYQAQANDLDNLILGNGLDNHIQGLSGHDRIRGAEGNDTVLGGAGDDSYIYYAGDGDDIFMDEQGLDTLHLSSDIQLDNLLFSYDDQDLVINFNHLTGSIRLQSWLSNEQRIEQLSFCGSTDKIQLSDIALNHAPIVIHDNQDINEDATLIGGNVLHNDSDPDGDSLVVVNAGTYQLNYGILALSHDGNYTYTLTQSPIVQTLGIGEQLTEQFEVWVNDDKATVASSQNLLTIRIMGENDAPILQADVVMIDEDITAVSANLLINDRDIDNTDILETVTQQYQGQYGTLTISHDGNYDYQVNHLATQQLSAGQLVTETFNYQATDGMAFESSQLSIQINGVNDAPIATHTIAKQSANVGQSWSLDLPDIRDLFNDIDQLDQLTWQLDALNQTMPTWLQFNPETGLISGVPTEMLSLALRLTAKDNHGLTAYIDFQLQINQASGLALMGSDGNDKLIGSYYNDTLNGGLGSDTLQGGQGDDIYYVDTPVQNCYQKGNEGLGNGEDPPPAGHCENQNDGAGSSIGHPAHQHHKKNDDAHEQQQSHKPHNTNCQQLNPNTCMTGDWVIELNNQGNDRVKSTVDYTLPDFVEVLELLGLKALSGIGNSLDNMIIGNAADNLLNGGLGKDTLMGGVGNDVYYVDNSLDVIDESFGQGFDTVQSTVTYTLSDHLEKLILTGSQHINATGNQLDNYLVGNHGRNMLMGKEGNDIYYVGKNDSVIEQHEQGIDTVVSDVSWILTNHIENIVLTGSDNISATANNQANQLQGNTANNTLTGLAGNDTYIFAKGWGVDTIIDKDTTFSNKDTVIFEQGINYNQLWFSRSANNLQISLLGTFDKILIKDWYQGTSNRIEEFKTADGHVLDHSKVNQLVQVMALMPMPTNILGVNAVQQSHVANVLSSVWCVL
ncbi:VCBS domain-containing protein [Agitococcus lubricus]